jgi:fructoselysine-6-P-deglycase FrlB-like protein
VQTRFATTALAFLRVSLGADITPLLGPARNAVAVDLPTTALASDHVVFLGTGWTIGLANEAALKLREAARFWTESYPAMEYRHGPMSAADHGSLVWILGTPPAGLVEDIAATGAGTRWSTVDPMVELVLVHRFAVALAEARGLDPDRPRNLARSVILG